MVPYLVSAHLDTAVYQYSGILERAPTQDLFCLHRPRCPVPLSWATSHWLMSKIHAGTVQGEIENVCTMYDMCVLAKCAEQKGQKTARITTSVLQLATGCMCSVVGLVKPAIQCCTFRQRFALKGSAYTQTRDHALSDTVTYKSDEHILILLEKRGLLSTERSKSCT